jgi:pyruvate,water dikinase
LRGAGLPVPGGFIVPAGVHRAAARELRALLERVAAEMDGDDPLRPETLLDRFPELAGAVCRLRPAVEAAVGAGRRAAGPGFMVRSSATREDGAAASFAGVFVTYAVPDAESIPPAVLLCWAAAYTRRARAYCQANGLDPREIAVAVVVQDRVEPEASGVLLTRDPLTGERAIVIDAVRGPGEALVSGRVTPESYRRLPDGSWEASGTAPGGGEPVLAATQRDKLAALAERVEQLMETPQDIEWAIQGDRIWLLQARPITTAGAPPKVWTRANLIELYPEVVSPLTASIIERCQASWLNEYFRSYGFRVDHLGPGMRVIRGRPYLNRSLLDYLADAAGMQPEQLDDNLGGHGGGNGRGWEWSLPRGLWLPFLRLFFGYLVAPATARPALRRAERETDRRLAADLEAPDDAELLRGALRQHRELSYATADVAGAIEVLTAIIRLLLRGRVDDPSRLLASVDVSTSENGSAAQVRDLEALIARARDDERVLGLFAGLNGNTGPLLEAVQGTPFGDALDRFLHAYGWRSVYESDSAVPRYAEDPTPLLRSIRAAVFAPPSSQTGPQQEKESGNVCAQASTENGGSLVVLRQVTPLRRIAVRLLLSHLRRLYGLRQRVRLAIVRWVAAERRWELALAERFAGRGWVREKDDFFCLRLEDVEEALSDPNLGTTRVLRERVERNRARNQAWAAVPMPLLWVEGREQPANDDAPARETDTLNGIPISPGQAEGDVAILRRPEDAEGVRPGAILVAPVAGPAWAPFYSTARGLIVEVGGVLSHGSILAREYGLPAVANVTGATRKLRDGERVLVDGSRGLIWRLDAPEGAPADAEETRAAA